MGADARAGESNGAGATRAPARAHEPTPFQRSLPNALTMSRVVMTVAFVAVLSVYRFPDVNAWALPTALVLFVVAALTDAADGYLARKWNAISVFGRIVDPLADKVLVLGAFIMLAGPGFMAANFGMISGVATWMVVVILSRELLVTTMRGALEGRGIDFSAVWSGKLKMIAQSIGVPLIIMLAIAAQSTSMRPLTGVEERLPGLAQEYRDAENTDDRAAFDRVESEIESLGVGMASAASEVRARVGRLAWIASGIAWIITLITAASVVPYVTRAMRAIDGETPSG